MLALYRWDLEGGDSIVLVVEQDVERGREREAVRLYTYSDLLTGEPLEWVELGEHDRICERVGHVRRIS